jgi:acetoacetate decarboxylase
MIHNYYMPDVEGMGEVEETNVMVGVKVNVGDEEHRGGFSTNLLISSEIGLTQGREIHGQPKKLGSTKIREDENQVTAEVFRSNNLVSRAIMSGDRRPAEVRQLEEYFPFRKNINHKVIRNIDESQGINQITSRTLADVVVKECWRAPSSLTLYENESAPFHLLPVIETLESFYWKADFALVPGVILHDYLKVGG